TGSPTGGDGCVFIFGSAGGAVAAAVEAQRALAAEEWAGGLSVRVRMAIHAGEVADVGDELFGMALHHTSRMLGVTHGGQVLVSGTAVGVLTQPPPDVTPRAPGARPPTGVVPPGPLPPPGPPGPPAARP